MEHHLNHTVDSRATTDTSTCNSRGRTTKELFTRLWDVDSIGFTSFDQRWIVLCRLDTIQVVFGMRACFKHLNNCRYLIEANIVLLTKILRVGSAWASRPAIMQAAAPPVHYQGKHLDIRELRFTSSKNDIVGEVRRIGHGMNCQRVLLPILKQKTAVGSSHDTQICRSDVAESHIK